MFTGIITDIGVLEAREGGNFRIRSHYAASDIPLGASIACDGCCLTVTARAAAGDGKGEGSVFAVEASNETLSRTVLGDWQPGRRINLERAMKLGDELGGHIVSGHVDGIAQVLTRRDDGTSVRFLLEAPKPLSRYIAAKGSVALNGVSLTVNEVEGSRFGINVIPFTLSHTNFGDLRGGDSLNLEIDMLARYVERLTAGDETRAKAAYSGAAG
jgi:riboflavin synthase